MKTILPIALILLLLLSENGISSLHVLNSIKEDSHQTSAVFVANTGSVQQDLPSIYKDYIYVNHLQNVNPPSACEDRNTVLFPLPQHTSVRYLNIPSYYSYQRKLASALIPVSDRLQTFCMLII